MASPRHHACVWTRAVILCFGLVSAARAGERAGDWTGDYLPCDRHTDLLGRGSMSLGVRFATSNETLAVEFARALDYWATILEMDWRREDSRKCAIQVLDGQALLFQEGDAARAQFPGRPSFQGWVAFNPKRRLRRE